MDISIIIPSFNRNEKLKRCLESIAKQNYPKDNFEVIIVDDGSSDNTKEMLAELSKEYKNLRCLYQNNRGPAAARNLGIRHSKGAIVAFTDSDCILNSDWVSKMVAAHRLKEDATAIGGATKVNLRNIKAAVSQFLSDGAIKAQLNGSKETIFFPTCNVSFKKKYLNEEFNELFLFPAGEDLEFFWRIFKKGHKLNYSADIDIFHDCHTDARSFLRQAYLYGRGNYLVQHVHNDHPLLKEIRVQDNFVFFFGLVINFLKIPRFSYLLGKRLIHSQNQFNLYERLQIFVYFALHKIMYLIGNIAERRRLTKNFLSGVSKSIEKIYVRPELVILDITHRCNLNCRICDIWKTGHTEQDIAISYIKDVLLEARGMNIKEIAFSGGEPLLRSDIFEILEYARSINIKTLGILTNGILVKKYLKELEPYLLDNTISIVVSLDSLNPKVHNRIRNSDIAWQQTMESLKALSLLKIEYSQVNFNVITIILDNNLNELIELAVFIKSLGANSLQFQPLLPNNLRMLERRKTIFWIPEERLHLLDEEIDKLIYFKNKNPQFIKNSVKNLSHIKKYFLGITSEEFKCVSAYKTVLISNQGECTTCFSSYGDVKKSSLKNIFCSSEIIKAREKVKKCPWPCLLPCFCP